MDLFDRFSKYFDNSRNISTKFQIISPVLCNSFDFSHFCLLQDCRSVQEIEEQVEEQMKCRKEAQIVGSVGWKTYKLYFSAVNSRFLVSLVAFCIIFGQLAISFVDVYISKW